MTRDPEIDCDELVEIVTDFLEGALDADTHRRVTEHLGQCDGCEAYVDQMRTTARLTGTLRQDELPPEMRDRLLAAFRGWKADTTPSA
ncbi:zf-HC2 domain-containing protein [Frankia sp. AgPm24]|uniref:Zf-HC2 domain-containing protein n=1 Tax=Frankia umida TaxID=573489 RepID=A0ABT0K268_9ACTN|nr:MULTISPECIES: zf-HC2 domain-containing protein [Frankia]MCK9877919.1 zf-HC2 domain-containing protein [Frankia umida]MCK9923967.1 zf-HC2 domain-containing protein [Frankia sp. AgPm24]